VRIRRREHRASADLEHALDLAERRVDVFLPCRHLPVDVEEKHSAVWVDIPSELSTRSRDTRMAAYYAYGAFTPLS
jgi:hypothetical protein